MVLQHLEGSKTHAKLLFIDFSSAFNSLQPHILADQVQVQVFIFARTTHIAWNSFW